MTANASSPGISQVATVFVPVANQDKALEFYVEKLGFEKRVDFQYGDDLRWIEVAPPGSVITLALVPPSEGEGARGDQTYCAWKTKDINAAHESLRNRGVVIDDDIARKGKSRPGLVSLEATIADPVPAQFFLRDLDGNRFLIVEAD
jgi:catechol 2,3-dioxygenase-like lactoylglutathione lyase family enzyme